MSPPLPVASIILSPESSKSLRFSFIYLGQNFCRLALEAAEYLGIGQRTLERYMAQGRVAYSRQKGKIGGDTVVFAEEELRRFKEELQQPVHQGAISSRQLSPANSSEMITSSQILAEIGESLRNTSEGIDAILEIVKQIAHQNQKVPVETKPLLTLHEAQQYSGLSRQFLLQAITENRLKGEKIGKSWRVRRRDLERFISKLF